MPPQPTAICITAKKKKDFHNLGWNDYGARFYDPQLGRWHALEPKEQFHASYSFCDNNPSNLRDVGGKFVVSGTVATRFDMPQFTVLTGVEAFTSWVGLGSMLIRSIHNDPAYRPSVADYLIAVTLAGFGENFTAWKGGNSSGRTSDTRTCCK